MADMVLLSRFSEEEQNAVKEFVRTVASLPGSYDEDGIEGTKKAIKFLLARKFDVSRAVELYRCHQRLRNSEGIHNIDPTEEGVRRELLSEKFTVLPGRDPVGAGVALFTARRHWPPYTTHRDTLKGLIFQLDAALTCEETQRNGIVFIYDMTESRYANFDYDLSIKILNMLKGHYPARLRKVLIVTAPLWFRAPFQVLRLFVREKLRDRVHTVDKRQLQSHLDPNVLPTTLGGCHLVQHRLWLEKVFKTLGVRKRIRDDYYDAPTIPAVPGCPLSRDSATPSTSSSPSRRGTPSGSSSEALTMVNGGEGLRAANGGAGEERVATMATIDSTSVDSATDDDCDDESGDDEVMMTGDSDGKRTVTDKNDNNRKGASPKLSASSLHGKRGKDELGGSSPETRRSTKKRSLAGGKCSSSSPLASTDELDGTVIGRSIHQADPDKGVTLQDFARKVAAVGPNGLISEYMSKVVAWSKEFEEKADTSAFRCAPNRSRNRYTDVLCLEATRVRLSDGSYIHANWVDSYKQKRAYICTQGPLANTACDLWNMIWEYEVPIIVMVTRTLEGRRMKCYQYWPPIEGQEEEYGDLTIQNVGVEVTQNFCKTKLRITHKDSTTRDVVHFYYTAWPDYGVPDTAQAFLDFLFTVREAYRARLRPLGFDTEMVDDMSPPPPRLPPPVLVHCSAGIGRTGTYITMDICLKRLADVGRVDLCETVKKLRSQRAGSIQMPQQYYFCHIALLENATRQGSRCSENCEDEDNMDDEEEEVEQEEEESSSQNEEKQ